MGGLLGAFAFLTRLPVPSHSGHLARTVPWLPFVGVVLGALLALADRALDAVGVTSLLTSTVDVVLLLTLTGALHADGLMDTCDAVFSHGSAERRLAIMRDPHVGAFGVVGLVCIVALKIAAIDTLPSGARAQMLVIAPTLGRWTIVLLASLFPYGRPSGMGGDLKAGITPVTLGIATLIGVVVCGLAGLVGYVSFVAAALVAVGIGMWLMRLLPGLTGDTYGATCEVVETVVWLGATPLLRWLTA